MVYYSKTIGQFDYHYRNRLCTQWKCKWDGRWCFDDDWTATAIVHHRFQWSAYWFSDGWFPIFSYSNVVAAYNLIVIIDCIESVCGSWIIQKWTPLEFNIRLSANQNSQIKEKQLTTRKIDWYLIATAARSESCPMPKSRATFVAPACLWVSPVNFVVSPEMFRCLHNFQWCSSKYQYVFRSIGYGLSPNDRMTAAIIFIFR